MRNVSNKVADRIKKNTHWILNNFFPENSSVYEIMLKNFVGPVSIAWWIPTATNIFRTCNSYCFPLQQWWHERASLLRYTHIVCPVLRTTIGGLDQSCVPSSAHVVTVDRNSQYVRTIHNNEMHIRLQHSGINVPFHVCCFCVISLQNCGLIVEFCR